MGMTQCHEPSRRLYSFNRPEHASQDRAVTPRSGSLGRWSRASCRLAASAQERACSSVGTMGLPSIHRPLCLAESCLQHFNVQHAAQRSAGAFRDPFLLTPWMRRCCLRACCGQDSADCLWVIRSACLFWRVGKCIVDVDFGDGVVTRGRSRSPTPASTPRRL